MSIVDIIAGRQTFLKRPTMRQTIASIEQDYAALASRGGGPYYLNSECVRPRYRRETGASIEDVAPPRGSLHPDAVDALLIDRNKANGVFGRLNFRQFQGPLVSVALGGAGTNFAWVASDRVPVGKFWNIVRCTVELQNASAASNQAAVLFAVQPGSGALDSSANGLPNQVNPLFTSNASISNGYPLAAPGFRIDDVTNDGASANTVGLGAASLPYEQCVLREANQFRLPEGWFLTASNLALFPGGGQLNASLKLKMFFYEFAVSEKLGDFVNGETLR